VFYELELILDKYITNDVLYKSNDIYKSMLILLYYRYQQVMKGPSKLDALRTTDDILKL